MAQCIKTCVLSQEESQNSCQNGSQSYSNCCGLVCCRKGKILSNFCGYNSSYLVGYLTEVLFRLLQVWGLPNKERADLPTAYEYFTEGGVTVGLEATKAGFQ